MKTIFLALLLNPLTPGTFCKKWIFGTFSLDFFKLDLSQISFNPIENAFATQQLAFLATSIAFYHIVTSIGHVQKSKFWESDLHVRLQAFWFLKFFFAFFASPFLFCLLQWLTFYRACLQLKTSKKASWRRANFSMEQPGVVTGNFALSFSLNFLSIFVHIMYP